MSDQDMNRIAKKMIDQYKAVRLYMKNKKSGDIHKLNDALFMAFGLSPRTAKERLEALELAGVFCVSGNTWKFLNDNSDAEELLSYMNSTEESPKDAFEKDLDKANRERHHIGGD